jgi:hypothetical protein
MSVVRGRTLSQTKEKAMAFWLAVACAEHVRKGRADGFMQVCHGKAWPLERIRPLDGVVYYSPSLARGGRDGFQTFTAIGTVKPGSPYQVSMTPDFEPFRRDVEWEGLREVPLRAVKEALAFTQARDWGYALRLGVLEITEADFAVLAEAMIVDTVMPEPACSAFS